MAPGPARICHDGYIPAAACAVHRGCSSPSRSPTCAAAEKRYYIAASNAYCAVKGGAVAVGGGACGNQSDYGSLVLAQLAELWTNYGALAELWCGLTPTQ